MAKGVRRKKSKYLSRFITNQIRFPTSSRSGYIFRYGSGVFFAAFASFISTFIPQPGGKTIFYLLFFLATLLTMFVGGSLAGEIVIAACVITSYVLLYHFAINSVQLIEIGLFLLTAFSMGVILDFVRNSTLLKEMNRRERMYQKRVQELEKNMQVAEKEILMRDEFLSIASHELKTPLTAVLLQIQLALHNIRNVSLAKFSVQNLLTMLESVEHQTQRLSKMINDLLNISLITTGKIAIEPEKMNLTALVKEAVEKIPTSMNKPDYPIHLTYKAKLVGKWDKVRIEQVVNNLLTNAIKYGNNNPVEVKLHKSDSHAELIIKDHGIGIPEKEQKRVFSRFERGKNSKKRGGLGVGLYISNQIVKAHHGKFAVQSKEGKGSSFTVMLPLAPEAH